MIIFLDRTKKINSICPLAACDKTDFGSTRYKKQ